MPGIGKTSLLYECVRRLKKHPDKYHAVYVTFSGGYCNPISTNYNLFFNKIKLHLDAFGMAILAQCVDPKEAKATLVGKDCDFATAMKIYRRHAAIADDVAVLFFVDEIGHIGESNARQLMSAMMQAQDEAIVDKLPRVGFVFTAVYNFLTTNRRVQFLALSPLPVGTSPSRRLQRSTW